MCVRVSRLCATGPRLGQTVTGAIIMDIQFCQYKVAQHALGPLAFAHQFAYSVLAHLRPPMRGL